MKKFLIGIFIGLIALFGITSTTSGTQYFLEYTQVKNAYYWDIQNNTLEIFLDNNLQVDNSVNNSFTLNLVSFETERNFELTINVRNETNESIQVFNNTYDDYLSGEYITFGYINEEGVDGIYMFFMFTAEDSFADRNILNNGEWIYSAGLSLDETFKINGIQIIWNTNGNPLNEVTVDEDNLDALTPYIGNLETLPDINDPDEPIPEPTPDSIESSIGNVIRGIIDWFVDIFNGLADAFVILDSSGQFVGFTVWGQVLFIEVGIGLVILVLKWVISLVRGV